MRIGGVGRGTSPVKMLLNGTMPAFVKSSVASFGTRGAEATSLCFLHCQNLEFEIWFLVKLVKFII